ncbi:hypothetical protein O59_001485 [Cellvibrio sp. BR]|nr:hypothetical protein O59_001485 [Cellvibrio sp. BR]
MSALRLIARKLGSATLKTQLRNGLAAVTIPCAYVQDLPTNF